MAREVNQDVSRLPVWAQNKIASLEAHVTNLENELEELSSKHAGTNNTIDQHHVYPDVDLPPHSQLLFYLGEGRDRWHNAVEVKIPHNHPDRLEIRGTEHGLRIIPSSYNGVRIELDK